jgi:hypothetical protein
MSGTIEVLSAEIRWAAKRLAIWPGLAGLGFC